MNAIVVLATRIIRPRTLPGKVVMTILIVVLPGGFAIVIDMLGEYLEKRYG